MYSSAVFNNLYVIKDRLVEKSGPIFEAENDQVALRQLYGVLRQMDAIHHDDYSLWRVGTIDHFTLRLVSEPDPVKVDVTESLLQALNKVVNHE